jgi:excinuclease UvrABC ATPase subunit
MVPDETIEVRGARENNLRDISVEIPRRAITVVTGVSGSGKSSLVFDTIAAEAQRQLNETFSTFVRNRLPKVGQPDVDAVERLTTPVIVDQRRLTGNSRSTVGTITDINSLLRLLFSRAGTPSAGAATAYSFNDPAGMCPRCSGLGHTITMDLDRALDRSKSLNDGAILLPRFGPGGWMWRLYAASGLFDLDKPLADYSERETALLLHGDEGRVVKLEWNRGDMSSEYEGLVPRFERLFIQRDDSDGSRAKEDTVRRFTTSAPCPACRGRRLNPAALASQVAGHSIADCCALQIDGLETVIRQLTAPPIQTVTTAILQRLDLLAAMGLGYLTLDRATGSLSGGESQRIKLLRHLSSSLTGMLYIFDEPSAGLHPHDVGRLNRLLRALRDKGNTVLVVEHDRDVIDIADHIIDMGPGAGGAGGRITYEGDLEGLIASSTPTGLGLQRRPTLKKHPRPWSARLRVDHANRHNLDDLTVDFPLGVLVAVSGVAGSGKSTLCSQVLVDRYPGVVVVDQSSVTGSSRSTPATYVGALDPIRRLFAKANGVSASLFSANSTGACPDCKGLGVIHHDLAFLDAIRTVCPTCAGRRFKDDVLQHTLRGASIADVLDMSVEMAAEHFHERAVAQRLVGLLEAGLPYLHLGQPLTTLSGGEAQRLKLAVELGQDPGRVYLLDEPTTGLHMSDVAALLALLDRLVDRGDSVIVIEHDLDVIAHADWVIDLGPGGGDQGGRVVFAGPPSGLVEHTTSLTGRHLADRL